jgi:hypothetical protein
MDQKDIREILARYYEGATTEEEEFALAEYFSGHDVPGEFEQDKEWFKNRRSNIPEPGEDFSRKLLSVTTMPVPISKVRSQRVLWVYRMAASVALLITGYLILHSLRSEPSYMNDTYNDPQLAMAEVQKVLSDVSLNMKKGTESLPEIKRLGLAPATLAPFTRASRIAEKSIEELHSHSKMTDTTIN